MESLRFDMVWAYSIHPCPCMEYVCMATALSSHRIWHRVEWFPICIVQHILKSSKHTAVSASPIAIYSCQFNPFWLRSTSFSFGVFCNPALRAIGWCVIWLSVSFTVVPFRYLSSLPPSFSISLFPPLSLSSHPPLSLHPLPFFPPIASRAISL